MQLFSFSAIFVVLLSVADAFTSEDIFVPDTCMNLAEHTDHVLIEWEATFKDESPSVRSPDRELVHLVLNEEGSPIHRGIKGMCPNNTRVIEFTTSSGDDMDPIFPSSSKYSVAGKDISLRVKVGRVTTANDFQIFDAIKRSDVSLVIDLIERHIGVNAFDEAEQTPLMIAAQNGGIQMVATLLNTRMPRVNVNHAKASGYNALFYSISHAKTIVLEALLRRGANPNTALLSEDSAGNTPLHFACLLEHPIHAALLLKYGADPLARNMHGQTPLELLPADAVNSLKMKLARLFKEAIEKQSEAAKGNAVAQEL